MQQTRGGQPFTVQHLLLATLLLLATGVGLRLLGRLWWCSYADATLWTADAFGPHNSQHLFDPYSLTHVLHGIVLYALLLLLLGSVCSEPQRGVIAIALESAWELIENTPMIIEQYRETTAAVGYYGDTIVNSGGDVLACAVGYLVAMTAPLAVSGSLFVGVEVLLLLWIRDSLLLNILMLFWPIEAIRNWQSML